MPPKQKKPPRNTLTQASLRWARRHLVNFGDTDLFPRPFEIEVIDAQWTGVEAALKSLDVSGHKWRPPRRILIPKSELAFRMVCQLDPLDALLFAAIMKEIGPKLEAIRDPKVNQRVFGHRFEPEADGNFYADRATWEAFWRRSCDAAAKKPFVAVADIAGFYSQIYHHTINNEMIRARVPGPFRKAINNLLDQAADGASRGLPIGPHPAHLLAEIVLCRLDEFLATMGYSFCRNVDDIHIFCDSHDAARFAIYDIAREISQQGLLLNEAKTKVMPSAEFIKRAEQQLIDQPINDAEREMLAVISKHSRHRYDRVSLASLSDAQVALFSHERIAAVVEAYLVSGEECYTRLRWFFRRLGQTGAPAGVEYVVENLHRLMPAIGDAALYLLSASHTYQGKWEAIGETLLKALSLPEVVRNEYLRVVILSLFSRLESLDHVPRLIEMFDSADAVAKRKIILALARRGNAAWLRTLRGSLANFGDWERRAAYFGIALIPPDERKHWFQRRTLDLIEQAIVDHVKRV